MGHDPDIRLPHVPGHELAGTIVEVGQGVRKWKAGQRVTVPFVGGCGSCRYCREGNPQVCDKQFQPGFTAWGSFAEYVAIGYADQNLVEIPSELDFVSAASLGCRFVTAYRAVADLAAIQPGQWLAIYGCGGVGLSAIQIGRALGARIIAVDINDEKCSFAKSLGADHAINASALPAVQMVRELSKGGVEVSMDALGHPETCRNSILSLRKGGKHLQVGLMPSGGTSIPMDRVIAHELHLMGSHGIQAQRYDKVFELVKCGGINLDKLISSREPLESVPLLLPELNNTSAAGIRIIDMNL
jgi:alcohol dehydrogenase